MESAYPESKLNLFCSGLWPIFAATAITALALDEEGESAVHIGKRTGGFASSCSSSSALTLKAAEEAFGGEELLSQNNFFIKSSSWRLEILEIHF